MTDNIVDISKARKKTKKFGFLGLFLLAIAICTLLLSPLFSVKTINVKGVSKISENTIISESGLYYGENLFCINKMAALMNISEISYVNTVTIRRKLPNTVNIFVEEKAPVAQIPFYGSRLIISNDKTLLDVVTDNTEVNLPELTGFSIKEVTAGEKINCEEEEKLESFLDVLNNFLRNDMLNKVQKLNEKDGILVYLDGGHVANVGDTSNLQYKILLLKEIMPKEVNASYIDLSDLEHKVTKPVWGMLDEEKIVNAQVPENTVPQENSKMVNKESIARGETNEE